jgi:hypothetical protein
MRITIIFYFLLISQFAKSQITARYLDVPISFIKKTFIDNKDSVNIREYPTIHSKMIDKLPTNFEFTFLNDTETFKILLEVAEIGLK